MTDPWSVARKTHLPPSPMPSPTPGAPPIAVMVAEADIQGGEVKTEESDVRSGPQKRNASPMVSKRSRPPTQLHSPTALYDPRTEPKPVLPYFHPDAEKVRILGECIIAAAQNFLRGHAYQGEEVQYFISWLQARKRPLYDWSNLRMILVGRSGAGKSLLLNALLGQLDLAIHGRSGRSVTYVIQEFHYARSSQKTPFEATVVFYPLAMWLETIIQHVAYYFEYQVMEAKRDACGNTTTMGFEAELEDDDPEEEESFDEDKFAEAKSRAGSAITVFLAVFPDMFPTREKAKEYLNKAKSRDDSRVLDPLTKRAETIHAELVASDMNCDTKTFSAATAAQLQKDVRPFISDVEYPNIPGTNLRCCLWAFVKVVHYWLKARALANNNTIVDSPGVTDTDLSRVDETRRHAQNSDITIVVDDVARLASEDSVMKELDEGCRRAGCGRVCLVGTYTDILGQNDEGIRFTDEEKVTLSKVRARQTQLQNMNGSLGQERALAISEQNHARACALSDTIHMNENERIELQQKEYEVRVFARNRRVISEVREKYRERTKDPKDLNVFLVSSAEYIKFTQMPDNGNPTKFQTAYGTGIPQLRSYIYGLPAEGRFATLDYWALTLVPAAMNRFRMMATVSKLERKDKVLEACKQVRKQAKEAIQTNFEGFLNNPCRLIVKKMRKAEGNYVDKAKQKCDHWKKDIKSQSHAAVLRRDGKHKTHTMAQQDWNDALLAPIRFTVDPLFTASHDRLCEGRVQMIVQCLDEYTKELVDTIADDPSAQASISTAKDSFDEYRKDTKSEVIEACSKMKENLQEQLRDIHTKTTTNTIDSYFSIAMKNVYQTALKAPKEQRKKYRHGETQHFIRCDVFKTNITKKNGPFNTLIIELEKAFERAIHEERAKLIVTVDDIYAQIQQDATRAFSTLDNENPNREAWVREALSMADDAKKEVEEMEELLAVCRRETTG